MSKRPHVLLIPGYYPAPENPVQGLFMRDLARAISLRNRVTLLAPPDRGSARDEIVDGIRALRFREPWRRGRVDTVQRILSLNAIVSRLRREGAPVDVLHAHNFSTGILAVLVGGRRNLPVVITENLSRTLTGDLSPYETRLARFTYRRASRVCPVSQLSEQRLRQLEPSGRYEVVPDAVDLDSFGAAERRTGGQPRQILTVSNLVPRKGLDHLLEAFRLLVSEGRNLNLTVVGEGSERQALEAQAVGLPAAFVGPRNRKEVIELLQTADVFAMPTLGDPFGIAAVEAYVARVPVVVTSAAGSADLLGPLGATVVAPGDAAAFREGVANALDAQRPVSAEAIEELRDYCGIEAVGARLDSIYAELSGLRGV